MSAATSLIERIVHGSALQAVARGVPSDVVEYASARTLSGLRGDRDATPARVRSYFNAVVRRRLVRHHGGTLAAARIIAASVVTDLVESGREPRAVVAELERGWAGQLPAEVIDEYRTLLCA